MNRLGGLHGTLTLPADHIAPYPAVLIISGSGPTDRDGNQPGGLTTDSYAQLAQALASEGIASVRYDKAGVGESVGAAPPRESAMRFEMAAHDAALFIEAMQADSRLGKITVVGHSEGGLLGILAHQENPADALVSLAGIGRPLGEVLREQLTRALTDDSLLATALDILGRLESGELVETVPKELYAIFRPSVQPYLISAMQYDPAKELSKVQVPVLIVQGTTDVQVSLSDAELLAAHSPTAMLEKVEGMNHCLKLDDGTPEQQAQRSYVDPSWPLAPELVDAIATLAADAE
jgi:alpha-beta hydrolase superfamily lysophospholipase